MKKQGNKSLMAVLTSTAAICLINLGMPAAQAADDGPIKIGVIGEESAATGASLTKGALIAADDINKAGGINGRKVQVITYDDHSSSSDAVRAFQRAVSEDHVVAVGATYISEVALALMPWAARLKMPFVAIGAASTIIPKNVHDDYEKNKYTFLGYMNAATQADAVCDFLHDDFVTKLGMKSAAIMSEDAIWTQALDDEYKACLPKAGLTVTGEIRFSPNTSDFTPIFRKIENNKADVIVTGMSHVGVQPTVQWHDQQVPAPIVGINVQGSTSTFWKSTNGAANGVATWVAATSNVASTPKTIPFAQEYEKRYGETPSYTGFAAYDTILALADAIKRSGSTEADKVVSAMEQTNIVGTQGHIRYYPKDSIYAHSLMYGKDAVTGLVSQWQNGKQVPVWPAAVAQAPVAFPSFVHTPKAAK